MEEYFQVLKELKFFKNIEEDKLKKFLEYVSEIETFEKGDVIVEEKEVTKDMYIIIKGEVVVKKDDKLITLLEEKMFFGEISFFDNEPRSASVIASDDNVVLLKIKQKEFLEYEKIGPDEVYSFILNMIRDISFRLRLTTEHLVFTKQSLKNLIYG